MQSSMLWKHLNSSKVIFYNQRQEWFGARIVFLIRILDLSKIIQFRALEIKSCQPFTNLNTMIKERKKSYLQNVL